MLIVLTNLIGIKKGNTNDITFDYFQNYNNINILL